MMIPSFQSGPHASLYPLTLNQSWNAEAETSEKPLQRRPHLLPMSDQQTVGHWSLQVLLHCPCRGGKCDLSWMTLMTGVWELEGTRINPKSDNVKIPGNKSTYAQPGYKHGGLPSRL